MRVRTAGTAAALAAAAALALTACGGGSGDGKDKITPESGTSAAGAAPSATPSAPAGKPLTIDPSLKLPADLRLQFGWTLPADHDRASVLLTSADFIQAMAHGVVAQSTKDPGLTTYATGDALSFGRSYVQQYIAHHWTLTGTDRYYSPVAEVGSGKTSAQVTLCEDQSKVYGKEIKTGKVLVTPANDSSFVSYTILLAKLPTPTALWQAQSITVKEKALQCEQ